MYDALCFKKLFRFEKLCSVFQPLVKTICLLSFSPRHCSAILDITHWMQVAYTLLHLPQCKDKLFSFKSKRKIRIHALMRMQKSVRCLRSMANIQNSVMRKDREETNCWRKVVLCIQKVFLLLHKIQIEPLMSDGLPWRCFSFFSGPRQCYLLGRQWDSHKPPGFYLKYLKLCSKDEQSFWRGVSL